MLVCRSNQCFRFLVEFPVRSGFVPFVAAVLLLSMAPSLLAQNAGDDKANNTDRAKSFRDRVTDRASLKDGTQLFGMAVSEKPAKLVVRTAWVELQLPDFYANELKPMLTKLAADEPSALVQRLEKEIELARQQAPDDRRRSGLLKEVRDRLVPDPNEVPEFVTLEVAKGRLRSLELQKEPRRELCRLAILKGLVDYEDQHWKSVTQHLQAIPEGQRKTSLPAAEDPDDDIDKILASVDVQLGAATKLVQSGDQVFDESQKPDLAALMSSMMGGNVQSLLNDLLNEGGKAPPQASTSDEFPLAAKAAAEKNQHKTVVLSSFEFDLEAGSATVSKRMFRQKDDGSWSMVLVSSQKSSVNDLKPGQADAIANDPQIKEISGLVGGLGIGGEKLDTALKMGAVVQNAMNSADNEFGLAVSRVMSAKGLSKSATLPELVLE